MDTEQTYDEFTCLKSAHWLVPILEKRFALEGTDHQAKETKQYLNQSVSPVCNNDYHHVESQSKLMKHSMTKRSLLFYIKRSSSFAILNHIHTTIPYVIIL